MGNHFVFGNVNSADYGVWISGSGTFNKPARRVERFTIPGRNGDLTIDEGRYENVTVTYEAFISRGFDGRFHDFVAAMMSQTGYQRLQDDYDGEHYRMAMFANELEPTVGTLNRWGKFTLEFNCMPQRFLVSGDDWVNIGVTSAYYGVVLDNPTNYIALPIIQTVGAGYMNIQGDDAPSDVHAVWEITVSNPSSGSLPSYIDIDSDIEECYYIANEGLWNEHYDYWNRVVTIGQALGNNNYFPVLYPGKTTIGVDSSRLFTSARIRPRWWEL